MTFLEKVCVALEAKGIGYAVVGGYAVSLHGAPRGTIDVDLVISFEEQAFIGAEEALKSLGLCPRLPVTAKEVFQFREEYLKNRHLVAWSFYNPQNLMEVVDIILTENLADCATRDISISFGTVRIIGKSDLIRMKEKSGRAQDLLDIEALRKL